MRRSGARGASRGCRLHSEPPAADAKDLKMVRQASPDGDGLVRCWLQDAPARQLVNIKRVPILIVVSEASCPRTLYDHCTSKFLDRMRASSMTFTRLPDSRHSRERAHADAREKQPADRGAAQAVDRQNRALKARAYLPACRPTASQLIEQRLRRAQAGDDIQQRGLAARAAVHGTHALRCNDDHSIASK